jgi:drug/metabolite transporter (DMT)-like permease
MNLLISHTQPGRQSGAEANLDSTTALLMLLAGVLHAGWHAIVKTGNGLSTLAGMGLASAALTAPFLVYVSIPPLSVWPVIALSLLLYGCYKAGLAVAYEQGDLSKAYPLARGMVPLCAAPLSCFALHQLPNDGQLAGIAIVSAGVLALALERAAAPIDGRLILAAFGASLMVAGYSVVDAYCTRTSGWASFTVWLIVLDSLTFFAAAWILRGPIIFSQMKAAKLPAAIAGVLGTCSFVVFVWALSRNPVAVVVAFRECSVLFATLIGLFILRERISKRRIIAVGVIAAGLIPLSALR